VTVLLAVSKATVASRLSLTPEYFSRVLHELEGAGLIRIERRQIRIPDPPRLAAWEPPGREAPPPAGRRARLDLEQRSAN
jgi:hypothetical protein